MKDIINSVKNLVDKVSKFEDGDLLAVYELKESFIELSEKIKSEKKPIEKKFRLYFDKILSYKPEIDNARDFIIDTPLFKSFSDDLSLLLENLINNTPISEREEKSIETVIEKQVFNGKYPSNYFANMIQDKEMLSKFYDEVKEHLENSQIALIDLEYDPYNKENINKVFRCFHTAKSSSAFLGIKNMEEISHEMENLLVLIRDGKIIISSELIDVIFYGIGLMKDLNQIIVQFDYDVEKIISAFQDIDIYNYRDMIKKIIDQYKIKKIGEILEEDGKINGEIVNRIIIKAKNENKMFGEVAVEENIITNAELNNAINKQFSNIKKSSFVKVSNDRLSNLIDMVGELVITQSMVKDHINNSSGKDLSGERTVTQLETITTNIKNLVLSMGMVPISEIFNKLRVVIRNVSHDVNKTIDVIIEGENTELDRNVIENIYDPLVHIVRNSCDHGIEPEEVRIQKGKSKTGKITITAIHKGSGIEISVLDDGAGISKDKILSKAIKLGFISEEQSNSIFDKDIFSFMFQPGFSTAEKVTEVSGRGVGLDVVKKNIEQIHGKIDIVTEIGKYTKFIIKIPLTLAIIDGFVTMINSNKYIFPFVLIDEIIVPDANIIKTLDNGQLMMYIRNKYIPVIFAGEFFNEVDYNKDIDKIIVIVINYDNNYYGIAVDQVLGKQEIVIKNLNEVLHRLKIFSGGTIFGDGSIGFVVDVDEFIEIVKAKL